MRLSVSKIVSGTFVFAIAPVLFCAGASDTATSQLDVTVVPEATITAVAAPLASSGTEFANYTGSTTFNYKIRTTETSGSGSITAQVTTEFASESGITTADLSYTAAITPGVGSVGGTANTTPTTASASTGTSVVTFGSSAHSSDAGDSGAISWVLANRPQYKTGAATTTVTLTISAT